VIAGVLFDVGPCPAPDKRDVDGVNKLLLVHTL
jgi:hypothetical protein